MTAIGSVLFCTDCGNLLERNTARKAYIECEDCGKQNKDTSSKTITTTSKPSAFPSTLRTRRSNVLELSESDMQTEVETRETCPKCGHDDQVTFFTLQLRSADEGSTVFYKCGQCGERWNTNN